MISKLDQVLDILMTPHLVSHDKKYILTYIFNFILLHFHKKKNVLKYAGRSFPSNFRDTHENEKY
jgi:hypothetical protein